MARVKSSRGDELRDRLEGPIYPVARFFISVIFIAGGFQKIFSQASTLEYMQSVGLPPNEILFWTAVAVELIGGFALLFGIYTRAAAWLLALYLVPVTLLFHTNFSDPAQLAHFMKNLAMLGGLLAVAVVERAVSIRSIFEPHYESTRTITEATPPRDAATPTRRTGT